MTQEKVVKYFLTAKILKELISKLFAKALVTSAKSQ